MRKPQPPMQDFGPTALSLSVPLQVPPRRHVLGWVVLFAAVSGALLAGALWVVREEAVRAGEELTTALARVIAEQTTRSIQTVDQRLQLAEHRLHHPEGGLPPDPEKGAALLREELTDLPFVRAIWRMDAQGRMMYHSDGPHVTAAGGDREFFLAHRHAQGRIGAYVGPMVRSRATGRMQMTVSRAVLGEAGEFDGVMVAAIEPGHFQSVWSGLDVGSGGVVTLAHRNGQLLMRTPPDPSALGRDLSALPLFTHWLKERSEGLFHRVSVIDDRDRVYAFRLVQAYPQLVVMVGTADDDVMGPWRRFAMLSAAIWLLSVFAGASLALQVQRHSARRQHLERRFGDLAQAMPQIVFMANASGVLEYVNQCWSEATGRPADEAIGRHWHELVHPEDAMVAADQMALAAEIGEPVQVEVRLRYADGLDHWQLVRARPNRNAAGEVASWYGTSTDIHEQKLAQEQLQYQADMLRLAGQLARLGSWELDLASGRLFLSDVAAAMMDLPAGAMPTLGEVYALMSPAGRADCDEAVKRCVESGEPFDMEGCVRTPAGREVWIRAMGQAVRDANGHVVRLQGAQQDVTQRVRMLAAIRELNATLEERIVQRTRELQRQEALFRTLAEQAPLPIWTIDTCGRATYFSPAWYDLVGGEPPRWLGTECLELLHPDDVAAVRANWRRCREEGSVFQGTRRVRARDGTFHTTSYRATPVRGEDGHIAFWVGIDADITDLIANEAALRMANEQLRAFSYSVSHDLQSPLQRIGSFAHLLERELGDLAPASRAAHYLGRISANAQEMVQLVQGLLSLAELSQADVVRGRVDLSAIASEILEGLHAGAPERQVRWRVEPGLVVLGDVRLMRSVLENLLGNAWKFTAHREVAEIVVGGSVERGEFFVRDNGAGFDMAHADKLFGTFQRLHRQDEFPGTGIGLATVARALQRQGGEVHGIGEPGRGATFRFTMPVPAAAPAEA